MNLFALTLYHTDPNGRTVLHAMPVMLGVLCVPGHRLPLLQRLPGRQGRGPRRLAASRRPTASTTARTTTRRTSGCCSATTSRPSPGPGRSSARCWRSSTATCRACSGWSSASAWPGRCRTCSCWPRRVRRGGKSLAEIARAELGRPAGGRRRRWRSCSSSSSPWPGWASSSSRRSAARR